jgi:hypothetical protein
MYDVTPLHVLGTSYLPPRKMISDQHAGGATASENFSRASKALADGLGRSKQTRKEPGWKRSRRLPVSPLFLGERGGSREWNKDEKTWRENATWYIVIVVSC